MNLEKQFSVFFSNKTETLAANAFISFDYHFIENRGNNFDLTDGIFTAPYKGIYEFTFSGHSPGSDAGASIQVLQNGVEINSFYSNAESYISISPSWICFLEKGDTIRLKLDHSTKMYTNENMYRTFSGKLLSHLP